VPEVARACLAALGNQLLSLKEQIVENMCAQSRLAKLDMIASAQYQFEKALSCSREKN
jgi:hypothetical protein